MRRFAAAGVLPAVTLVVLWLLQPLTAGPKLLTVVFLDVGQGDSIFVETPSGKTMLVDTGRLSPDDDAGRRVVVPFLRSRGLNRIDAMLLTHPDDDHIGGARSVMDRLGVGRLLISDIPSPSKNYSAVLSDARSHHVGLTNLARGQALDFRDGVVADVLNPPAGEQPRVPHADNNGSLVVRIRRGQTSVMLTGDAETEAEADMVASGMGLHADVLKLGHHGSHTSSSPIFLDAVSPRAAIVSAGLRNLFGHPHPEVLARVEARGIRLFRTDREGAITVTSDGHTLSIHRARVAAGR